MNDKLNYSFRLNYIIILILAATLNFMGVMLVRSATGMDNSVVTRQILGSAVGFTIALGISFINYRFLLKFAVPIYIFVITMLIATVLWGAAHHGAGRWIEVPVLGSVQPAEFAKAGLILCYAAFFYRNEYSLNEPSVVLKACILFGIPEILIFIEPNLSTTIIFFVIFACMYVAAGLSVKIIGLFAGGGGLLLSVIYFLFSTGRYENIPFIKDYQKQRILSFLYPEQYGDSFLQQKYSMMAIGSGGFFGKGLYNTDISSLKAGNFLIEEETDFIFAVIGEELGFRGSVFIIILYLLLVIAILSAAQRAQDIAGACICVGVAAWIGFQTFTNIAVTTALFPNTGVTLPFFSKGVSSLLSLYLGLGLCLNVALQPKQ